MAKMYTLDSKLLTGTPEIRVGDKVYPVDDRQKTVKKILDICDKNAEKKDLDTRFSSLRSHQRTTRR